MTPRRDLERAVEVAEQGRDSARALAIGWRRERDAAQAHAAHWRRNVGELVGWQSEGRTDGDLLRRLRQVVDDGNRAQRVADRARDDEEAAYEAIRRIANALRPGSSGVRVDDVVEWAREASDADSLLASREKLLQQAEQFEAELIAVDEALASAGATLAVDRVEAIRALMDERDTLGADLVRVDSALDVGGHETVAEAAERVRLERDTDRATSKALARRVAWLEGDDGDVHRADRVPLTMTDGDDAPTELRALARELHRWAPNVDALAIRDRLLDVARFLDGCPTGAAARQLARRLTDTARATELTPDGVVDARILDALDRWDGTVPPGRWVCDACGIPVGAGPCPEHQPDALDAMRAEADVELSDHERAELTRTMTAAGDPGPVLALGPGRRGTLAWTATRVYGVHARDVGVTMPRDPSSRCSADLDGAVCARPAEHTEPGAHEWRWQW